MAETKCMPCGFCPDHRVSMALYKNVTNCKEIRQLALSGKLNVSLIKPSMIIEEFHIMAAATKALLAKEQACMVTKTIHSEVLYSLSATKNISDCFRRFGLADSDQSLLLLELHLAGESGLPEVQELVKGDSVSISQISDFTNKDEVMKVYKVKEADLTVGTLVEAAVGRMASKEFLSH